MKPLRIPDSGIKRIAQALGQDFSIEEIHRQWVESGETLSEENFPLYFELEELLPYREYVWTRDQARLNPEEWDELSQSMVDGGWDPNSPVLLLLGKDGTSKVGEGNHRLAIAEEAGIGKIPVIVEYRESAEKDRQLSPEEVEQDVVERGEKQEQERLKKDQWDQEWSEMSPEERQELEDLADLLL